MKDEELKELSKKIWQQYWGMTMLSGLASKFPSELVPFFEHFFESGFIEGYKTKEENK